MEKVQSRWSAEGSGRKSPPRTVRPAARNRQARSRSLSDSPQPVSASYSQTFRLSTKSSTNLTTLVPIIQDPTPSTSFSCIHFVILSRSIDPYNIHDEVNSCYFCSGIPSLGHDMLTSSNRISHYLNHTNSLLLPEPLRISKPPDVNCIPDPPLRRKNPLRSRRRHSKLPQIPPLLHLLQRHQAIFSRC